MKTERPGPFAQLEPPPGGAERFHRRLSEAASAPHAPRWRIVALAGAAGVAVALIVAAVVLHAPNDAPSSLAADSAAVAAIYDAPQFDRLLGRSPPPAGLAVTRNEQPAAVAELQTANDKVRIYRID
jgi:hypothetical protein